MDGVRDEAVVIRVGDHVRWSAPDFDVNIIWEVTRTTRKSFHLRCDIERGGKIETKRHRAQRDDCTLVAHQLMLAEARHASGAAR